MNRRNFIKSKIAGEVLNIGCAGSSLHQFLLKIHNPDLVYGIDVVKCEFPNTVIGDAQRLSEYFPQNFFDTVVAGEVIEHLEKPLIFLKEVHKILKPGGGLLITTPNLNSWNLKLCRHGHHSEHISLMSEEELRRKCNFSRF